MAKKITVEEIKEEYRYLFDNKDFKEAWAEWRAICVKKGSVESPRSWNRHLKDVVRLSGNNIKLMIKIVDQSSDGGVNGAWTKLYAWNSDNSALPKSSDYGD